MPDHAVPNDNPCGRHVSIGHHFGRGQTHGCKLYEEKRGGLLSPSYREAVDAHERDFVQDMVQESVSGRTPSEEGEEVIMVETTSTEESGKPDMRDSVVHADPLMETATISDMGSPTASLEDVENEISKTPIRSSGTTTSILMNSTRPNKPRRKFFPDDEDDDQTKEASVVSRKSSVSWADEVLQKHDASSTSQYDPTPHAVRAVVSGLTMTPTPSFAGYIEDRIDALNQKSSEKDRTANHSKPMDPDQIAELSMSQQESVQAYLENKIDFMNNKALAESIERTRGAMSSKLEISHHAFEDSKEGAREEPPGPSLNLQLGKLEPGDERRAALDLA